MSVFRHALAERSADPAGRRWIFVPYDQLTDAVGPLAHEDPAATGIVLVESPWKAARRPYHKQKLALVLANLRAFALEQAERGVAVRHVVAEGPYRSALEPIAAECGPLRVMRPAERELREDLAPLVEAGLLDVVPHEGWLTTRGQFETACAGGPPYRMDAFYRHVRRETGILMDGRRPVGGKFSHDVENRLAWSGDPPPVSPPRFPSTPIKDEVAALIADRFASHPGALDVDALPATREDAEAAWAWARRDCLPRFGPFEDAMSVRSTTIFHTRISSLLNLHRLIPRRVVDDALALDIPLASKEGFVRQILGWREYVRHVHDVTDGFRTVARTDDASRLPLAFWGERSGLACLDTVVASVWNEGYSHHITRLMVLSNLATLLDLSPRALTDWFWTAYTDAYDWVVEPNVLGMGTYALGDLMTTKPYVSGAAYIARMSDYCGSCAFDPKADCPITPLYWHYLARNETSLRENPRMRVPLAGLRRRPPERCRRDGVVFRTVRERLRAGRCVRPADLVGERP